MYIRAFRNGEYMGTSIRGVYYMDTLQKYEPTDEQKNIMALLDAAADAEGKAAIPFVGARWLGEDYAKIYYITPTT